MSIYWQQMGVTRWPLALSLAAVLALTAYSAALLFRRGARADARTRTFVDGILFWGGFAMIWGVLGTVVGMTIAADAIEKAPEISPGVIWGGIKVALLTTDFGMLILMVSALAWFTLQLRWRMLAARELASA